MMDGARAETSLRLHHLATFHFTTPQLNLKKKLKTYFISVQTAHKINNSYNPTWTFAPAPGIYMVIGSTDMSKKVGGWVA